MTFYTDALGTVQEMLASFGAPASLTRNGPPTYDPATSTATSTPTVYTVQALEYPAERSFIDGSLIEAGHAAYLIDPNGLAINPKAGDVLTWLGEKRAVVKAGTLAPAGVAVLHEVQVRN